MSSRIGPLTLAEHNRRIIAARCHWPAGVLETCERLDAVHWGWSVGWLDANNITGWERPAGYHATLETPCISLVGGDQLRRRPEDGVARTPAVFAPTVDELAERIAGVEARVEVQRLIDHAMWASMRRVRHLARCEIVPQPTVHEFG